MTRVRRWSWCVLGAAALAAAGCNVLSLPFFIMGPEPKVPATMQQLASDDKEKEVKVVVLAAAGLETRTELVRADRDLAVLLTKHLRDGFKYNNESVKVISPTKVENFKSEHPDWQKWDLEDIGKHFEVDYLVYLEVNSLSLYEKGSNNTLYRGRAEVTVSLLDINHPDEVVKQKYFTGLYPGQVKPPVEVSESNPLDFRRAFLDYMAEQMSWYFTSHPSNKDYSCR